MDELIPEVIAKQFRRIEAICNDKERQMNILEKLVMEEANKIVLSIKDKLPFIRFVPLYYIYSDEYSYSMTVSPAIDMFKDYSIDNNLLTANQLELIDEELTNLYYLADTLIYYMDLTDYSLYDCFEEIFAVSGNTYYLQSIYTLIDCFKTDEDYE